MVRGVVCMAVDFEFKADTRNAGNSEQSVDDRLVTITEAF